METLPFNKAALLENLKIQENSYGGLNIKLINKNVRILLSTGFGDIMLNGFYKGEGIEKKGITRCALYVLCVCIYRAKGGFFIEDDERMSSDFFPDFFNFNLDFNFHFSLSFVLIITKLNLIYSTTISTAHL